MKKIFVVGNTSIAPSIGLLILRISFGAAMLMHHGLDKLNKFHEMSGSFPDPLHLGSSTSLALSMFAEVAAAALLTVGLLTRLAALILVIDVGVAFIFVHNMSLGGQPPGELAFLYLAAFITLLFAGPGKVSIDGVVFK